MLIHVTRWPFRKSYANALSDFSPTPGLGPVMDLCNRHLAATAPSGWAVPAWMVHRVHGDVAPTNVQRSGMGNMTVWCDFGDILVIFSCYYSSLLLPQAAASLAPASREQIGHALRVW
jgi:hypothetical protein